MKYLIILLFASTLMHQISAQGNPFISGSRPSASSQQQPPSNRLVRLQQDFQNRMNSYFQETAAAANLRPYLLMSTFALLFGIFHALGPGHKKMVLVSAIMKKQISLKTGILAGSLMSVIHGASSILLITILDTVKTQSLLVSSNQLQIHSEKISYGLIVLIGIILLLNQLRHHQDQDDRGLWAIIISGALVPCPAAAGIMLFTISFDAFWTGVLMVGALSLGMAIVTVSISVLTVLGRGGLSRALEKNQRLAAITDTFFHFASPVLLIAFGLLFLIPQFMK